MLRHALVWLSLPVIVFGIGTQVTVGDLGDVIGTISQSEWNNRSIYNFHSIPYAEPPIGDLRFRPPVKLTSWNGTLDATSYGPSCVQTTYAYSEDCLTLNVFVPERQSSDNETLLPVLIFIHGGTFREGTGTKWHPDRLLDEADIILVVPQFRLGFFGLFSMQTDDIPGNVQFLDQIMAMQWVQDNIEYFGGNKNQVTIMGHSSGAATVHYHILSPLTEGLFHRTILQSGSALRTYGIDDNPIDSSRILAAYCGCNNMTDNVEIAACVRAIGTDDLLNCTKSYLDETEYDGLTRAIGHMAVVQTAGDEIFLTATPRELTERGEFIKLPMMAGVTKNDGSSHFSGAYDNIIELDGLVNNTEYARHNLTSYVLKYLGITDITTGILFSTLKTYFQDNDFENIIDMAPSFIDLCSVISYKSGSYETLQTNHAFANTYAYTFDYPVYSPSAENPEYPFDLGVDHGSDTRLLFPTEDWHRENDLEIAKVMVQLYTSFVISGIPEADGVTWPAMSTSVGPYLIIDTSTSIGDNFLDVFITSANAGTKSTSMTTLLYFITIMAIVQNKLL